MGTGAKVARIPPPLYYGVAFAGGMALHRAVPLAVPGRPVTAVVGAAVLVAGLSLVGGGVGGVVRHRTTIVPHHPVSALVTSGAYRFSRNPMYAGLAGVVGGAALLAGSWWPLLTLSIALLIVRRVVIDPEERYLDARFGPAYAAYRARVRRWL
ncbi:MAG: isoprenylcysteine carboxylmethyltransferase family protein [Mycobacteriales bacterium]